MTTDLLEQLRAQLRRDTSNTDAAFLLSVAVREPFIVYHDDRVRLRRLLSSNRGEAGRELLIAKAAEELLAKGATPSRGLRRPEPGGSEFIDPGPPPAAEVRRPRKRGREAETLPPDLPRTKRDS